eukprot:CAMPEP_0185028092 /NCGR_PEP_ID=MMETSP1103-20130426/13601_1 /TAXON_ID=36769 /ORGANISM="Paraphysomonas bandaiensis, Strain Caron Lab Isolate" /LENGTH=419 /DNA_ID=CAMNT_0027562361 /DNA_START=83 /DNA_END=1339 /DNA_ORIENTATION=-
MINRQRESLLAEFARDNLEIHRKVVSLYMLNLTSICMNGLITLHYALDDLRDFSEPIADTDIAAYPYLATAVCGVFFAIAMSLLSAMSYLYGKVTFLQGESHEDVLKSIRKVKKYQLQSAKCGVCCIVILMLQTWAWTWGTDTSKIFLIAQSSLYISGFYFMVTHGKQAIALFTVDSTDPVSASALVERYMHVPILEDPGEEEDDFCNGNKDVNGPQDDARTVRTTLTQITQVTSSASSHAITVLSGVMESRAAVEERKRMEVKDMKSGIRKRLKNLRARGVIWNKSLRHVEVVSPCFSKTYAVIERGVLNFYSSKDDFADIRESIDLAPVYLQHYEIETNMQTLRQYSTPYFSVRHIIRGIVSGSEDMFVSDAMSADFDVYHATRRLQFALIPKDSSELGDLSPIILMAEDDQSYRQW